MHSLNRKLIAVLTTAALCSLSLSAKAEPPGAPGLDGHSAGATQTLTGRIVPLDTYVASVAGANRADGAYNSQPALGLGLGNRPDSVAPMAGKAGANVPLVLVTTEAGGATALPGTPGQPSLDPRTPLAGASSAGQAQEKAYVLLCDSSRIAAHAALSRIQAEAGKHGRSGATHERAEKQDAAPGKDENLREGKAKDPKADGSRLGANPPGRPGIEPSGIGKKSQQFEVSGSVVERGGLLVMQVTQVKPVDAAGLNKDSASFQPERRLP